MLKYKFIQISLVKQILGVCCKENIMYIREANYVSDYLRICIEIGNYAEIKTSCSLEFGQGQ